MRKGIVWIHPVGLLIMVGGAVLAAPAPARGQDDAPAAAEPTTTEPTEGGPEHAKLATSDATPVGAHAVEMELSYSPSWNLAGHGEFERSNPGSTHPIGLAVTYGLTTDIDVNVELSYAFAYDSSFDFDPDDDVAGRAHGHGFGDLAAGARWRFLSAPGAGFDLAVTSGLVLPTGADASVDRVGLSQEFWSFEGALVASKDWGPLTANAELGFSLPFGDARGSERGALIGNLAAGWQVLPWLQPELELNYERTFESAPEENADLLCLTGGAVAPFGDGYRIAAGLQYAVWGGHTGQSMSATLAFKWAF